MCKLKNELYGLKHAPKGWYTRLDRYHQQQGFKKDTVNTNLYIKYEDDHLLVLIVYVDDIIFGSNLERLGHKFKNYMQTEFGMSMIGEFSLFL